MRDSNWKAGVESYTGTFIPASQSRLKPQYRARTTTQFGVTRGVHTPEAIHLSGMEHYFTDIFEGYSKEIKYPFTFKPGARIAEIKDYIPGDLNTIKIYATKDDIEPLKRFGYKQFYLTPGMKDDDFVLVDYGESLPKPFHYTVVAYEITDIRSTADSIEERDKAEDIILNSWKVHSYFEDKNKYKKDNKQDPISVCLHADPEEHKLYLEGNVFKEKMLYVIPDDYPLRKQREAVLTLMKNPQEHNKPLLNLLKKPEVDDWGLWLRRDVEYEYLKDNATEEQKDAVVNAVSTKDFFILEGPPGSGKTTVLLETIIQQMKRGNRVLLTASTHVAVDNILERLKEKNLLNKFGIVAIRIGEENKINDNIKEFRLSSVAESEHNRLLNFFKEVSNEKLTDAQREFYSYLRGKNKDKILAALENLVVEAANLVCGTTIGILQAPMIKRSRGTPQNLFHSMILDEASKTTFSEFLVPALYCERFIISGDPCQLSPYTDPDEIEKSVFPLVPEESSRKLCKAIFDLLSESRQQNGNNIWKTGRIVLCRSDEVDVLIDNFYKEIKWLSICKPEFRDKIVMSICKDANPGENALRKIVSSNLLILSSDVAERIYPYLPPWFVIEGSLDANLTKIHEQRRAAYFNGHTDYDGSSWESAVSWRMCRKFELRHDENSKAGDGYKEDIMLLTPKWDLPINLKNLEYEDEVLSELRKKEGIAFSSILDILENGCEGYDDDQSYVLSGGLKEINPKAWNKRHILLSEQWRMHPDIADFPSKTFYGGKALITPSGFAEEREFKYPAASRVVWVDVDPEKYNHRAKRRDKENPEEVEAIEEKVKHFLGWARKHPKENGEKWTIAILTFYLKQSKRLSEMFCDRLAGEFGFTGKFTQFRSEYAEVKISTVDKFQGQEADVEYLSFVRYGGSGIGFLDSRNRMNVALTRAKYQLYLVGSAKHFMKSSPYIPQWLRKLAEDTKREARDINYRS